MAVIRLAMKLASPWCAPLLTGWQSSGTTEIPFLPANIVGNSNESTSPEGGIKAFSAAGAPVGAREFSGREKRPGEPRHRDAEIAEKEAWIHSFTCDSAVHSKTFGRSQVNLRRFFVV